MLYPQQNEVRNVLELSGLWHFVLDREELGLDQGWAAGPPPDRLVAVPGSWNEQFQDTWDYMGPAWYSRGFYPPSSWRAERVWVRVGSANYAAKVWLNGVAVGEHEGGHLPFDLEVTQALAWGRPNTLVIRVDNALNLTRVPPGGGEGEFMRGHPSTAFDFFPYGGLQRPVLLYSVPERHIADVTVRTDLEDAVGVVHVAVEAPRYEGAGQIQLVGENAPEPLAVTFRDGKAEAVLTVPGARLWGPDDPYLYTLTVTLQEGDAVRDRYELEVGIRTIRVDGDRLLLNGKPVFLRGAARHEDFPIVGRGLSLPVAVKDTSLYGWMGANSYRTAHYPHAEEMLRLADHAGLLVISETPAVGLSFADEDGVRARQVQCLAYIRELVARDKNHPSVIMWSVANEPAPGGMGISARSPLDQSAAVDRGTAAFGQMFDLVRSLDPTRPATLTAVHGCPTEWLALCDVICLNRYYGWYMQTGQVAQAATSLAQEIDALHAELGKPMMLTEFGAEALAGTHGDPPTAWTEEYQRDLIRAYMEVIEERPFMVGAHVWVFADFATPQSIIRPAGRNHKGLFTRERQPKMSAHMLRERWHRQ